MKKKSSHKNAMPAQRLKKKKPVAGRIERNVRKPASVKGKKPAQAADKPAARNPDPFRRGKWRVVERWEGLFTLSIDGDSGDTRADLAPEMEERFKLLLRGHTKEDVSGVYRLERGLEALGYAFKYADERCVGGGATDDLIMTLGKMISAIQSAQLDRHAEDRESELRAFFKKALAGILKERKIELHASVVVDASGKTGTKGKKELARGGNRIFSREVVAICFAKAACKKFHRLPTKSELRAALEQCGEKFAANKDQAGKWRELFFTAGLDALKP
jgi:hypothetical protein